MPLRRALPDLLAVLLLAVVVVGYFALRPADAPKTVGAKCPPGFDSREKRTDAERRERAGQTHANPALVDVGAAAEEEGGEEEGEGARCVSRRRPESRGELMRMQTETSRRSTGGVARTVKPGAYRAAIATRTRLAADGTTLPGSGGEWKPYGEGPLIADERTYTEASGLGLADLNGRVSDFARDAAGGRLFAAIGEGGVWESTDTGRTWRSIGEGLPTQAVGGIDYSTADGGTIIVATGDNVFGGGGTFAGMGVFRSTDGGRSWHRATGDIPDNVIAFKVAVDPTNPNVVYAATGGGLFRSENAGRSFTNVGLPTGEGVAEGEPDCTGKLPTVEGCFLANMVTDVVVQQPDNDATDDGSPGAKTGSVVAVVGWRAGDRLSPAYRSYPDGVKESPSNGVYRSDTGAPGTFQRTSMSGFAPKTDIGRIELGHATGPEQDHNYLYALVQDSGKLNGEPPGIDLPGGGPVPNRTTLQGIYVSDDFGDSWTQMESGEELMADPASGSALAGVGCGLGACPGVQAWYNQFIAPDPTRQIDGVPARVSFGLEEVWENDDTNAPQSGKSRFVVTGPYFSGDSCQFLSVLPVCPTTAGDPAEANLTTHPDQHAIEWIPDGEGGVTQVVGHDGGVNVQHVNAGEDIDPDGWGRGANDGFNTLLPYDAQIAKDGTVYAGLQDNGEMKIDAATRKQYMVFGGDGAFSAVDPDNSDIAYEAYTFNDISKTSDGGKTFSDVLEPEDAGYQFINPFTMDPLASEHLITAGNAVHETNTGGGSWTTVFDLGTRDAPGDPDAAATATSPNNSISAIDVRAVPKETPGGVVLKPTADVPEYEAGGDTIPGADACFDAPPSHHDQPFTIAEDELNESATIEISWESRDDDWDLYVLKDGEEVGSSTGAGGTGTTEKAVLTRPDPGDYIVRACNWLVTPGNGFTGKVTFKVRAAPPIGDASAAYVAYCGYCDQLINRPFGNGIATNVTRDGKVGKRLSEENWHVAKAEGLPDRFITSVQIDPADPKTVYATIAGYSRRWLPVGVLGEEVDVSKGNVFKSTDAGETFANVSGNLPDVPANWTAVRNGQLIVATNIGAFISKDTDGGAYEVLGSGLPTAPVFTLEMKPKAPDGEPDTMIAATQGRGVYAYEFKDPPGVTPGPGTTPGTTTPTQPPAKPGVTGCAATSGFKSVSASRTGRGVKLGFERRISSPVVVDVFRVSVGRTVIRERLVARFTNRSSSLTWNGLANRGDGKRKRVGDGYYFVRYRIRGQGDTSDVRRLVLRRTRGKFTRRPDFYRRASCDLVKTYKLERPVFGGASNGALGISYRVTAPARLEVVVSKGSRTIKRFAARSVAANRTFRLRVLARGLSRGDYRVRLTATSGKTKVVSTLVSRRL